MSFSPNQQNNATTMQGCGRGALGIRGIGGIVGIGGIGSIGGMVGYRVGFLGR